MLYFITIPNITVISRSTYGNYKTKKNQYNYVDTYLGIAYYTSR